MLSFCAPTGDAAKVKHFISFEKFVNARRSAGAPTFGRSFAPGQKAAAGAMAAAAPGVPPPIAGSGPGDAGFRFGDINELTDQLDATLNQTVDARFLDGFAPAKNPDMYAVPFNAMARLARPGATLATFTSLAGFVRRGLQEAGFTMQKRKGFGRKREMLCGVMEQHPHADPFRAPRFLPQRKRKNVKRRSRRAHGARCYHSECYRVSRLAGDALLRR